jgi:hypothetical protein
MNDKRNKLREELEAELPHFTGTEEYHRIRYPWLRKDFLLTDGAKYLADKAAAYWLIDIVASYQLNKKVATEGYQSWKLYVNHGEAAYEQPLPTCLPTWKQCAARTNEALVTCDDGNKHILVTQEIPSTDFPLDEVHLYVTNDDFNGIVVMLPPEY